MKTIRNKISTGCILLGIALMAASLCLFIRNWEEARSAADAAETVLAALKDTVAAKMSDSLQADGAETSSGSEMSTAEINGYEYVGYVSIPALELELPVMAEWDYTRLKIAPCRYYGSAKTDDLVIAAHNYSRHFGRLSELEKGDEVIFTDTSGREWNYSVVAVDVLSPTAVEEMTTAGYALTLFTCTYGGASRITVRCERNQ